MPEVPRIVPSQLNPEIDPELWSDVNFFKKWGYLIVEDAITKEEVRVLRGAMDDLFLRKEKERDKNHKIKKGSKNFINEQFTKQLLEEDDRFVFLLDNPPVLKYMKAILGNCIQLHSATSRITHPGDQDQDWHRDGPWPMDPEGTPFGSIPGQINCLYFLDKLTTELGPTLIVPGSHRVSFAPPVGHPKFPDEKHLLAKPGQAVLINGWLYHRGTANTSKKKRRGCYMCYQNAWMKSRETFDGPRIKKLRENGTPEQQLLLGGVTCW